MRRFCKDMKKYWKWVFYAGRSDLNAEVANSHLNWLWWVIEPFCFMLIYSFVFGILFASKIDHVQVFIYIGITMWDFFSRTVKSSVKIVRSNKSIVSKVYIPKYMLVLEKMYVNAFKMMIAFILLVVLIVVTRVPFTLYMLWIFPVLLVMFVFTFGCGTILAHFGVYVDDLENVVNIVLKMLFYLTGVFYELESKLTNVMSARMAARVGHINPMASLISSARDALMYGSAPRLKYLIFWFVVGIVFSVIGIVIIYKNENSYVKVI